jgi:hypothetical protein
MAHYSKREEAMTDKHNRTFRQTPTTMLFPLRSQVLLGRAYALILSWNEADRDLAAKADIHTSDEVVVGDDWQRASVREQEPTQ